MRTALAWLGWVLLSFAPSLTAIWAPPGAWYDALAKPTWTPPDWVFPVVWTTLYAMMGTAAWLVWRASRTEGGGAYPLTLFLIQLVLNAAWTPFFFAAHELLVALIVILALWIAIAMTISAFRKVSKLAAVLLVPYLAWVTLATALNHAIWRLNA